MTDMQDEEFNKVDPEGCAKRTVFGMIVIFILLWLSTSCGAPIHALLPEGRAIEVHKNRVHVAFPDTFGANHGAAWFFFPGIEQLDTAQYKLVLQIQPK